MQIYKRKQKNETDDWMNQLLTWQMDKQCNPNHNDHKYNN